jgi:hypothetical protein
VLVVLASRFDSQAAALAAAWGPDAALMTPADLSTIGWCFDPADLARSTAVVAGGIVPCAAIGGVVTALPCVFEHELDQIAEEDRRYVASEMTAFLLAWLTALPCPVVNRPHPNCLSGPPWSTVRWRAEARRAGFQLSAGQPAVATLNVVGDQCFGVSDPALAAAAHRLAAAARADVLALRLDARAAVVSAAHPGFSDPQVGAALERLIRGRLS